MEGLVMQGPKADFWRGKRVLLTGHTGFKGSWLALWLHRLGAQVVGLSLPPATTPSLFNLADIAAAVDDVRCDIRDATALAAAVRKARPEIVLHLAAQALVRPSYSDPLTTFASNVMGTAHVLDALRGLDGARAAVVVTTDKVYQNLEWPYPYREDDALGGHDPYSASKAAAELVVASYRSSYLQAAGVAVASARAGNVIGGGDWAQDRLLPDAARAWLGGTVLDIRRPQAIRPWQHVLEPLAAYLVLAEKIWHQPALAGAYNFGPATQEAATVRQVVELARQSFPEGQVTWGDGQQGPHEAGWLALEVAKARTQLAVAPVWNLSTAVERSMAWYRQQADGASAQQLCLSDIEAYEASIKASGAQS
jgi:CDP-glucose 4,6-dehydratase